MNRRQFTTVAAAAGVAATFAEAQGTKLPIRKAVLESMLPKDDKLSIRDRFQMGRDVGFEAVECHTEDDPKRAEEMKAAAESTGLRIHSVMNEAHWKFPLSSADPQVVAQSIKGMETSLRNAKFWGADTVLLVPAVVNPETSYKDAWTRSQTQIRKLLPLAEELKVVIAVEEVWNKFLLSPLEMARYVDDFQSPWLKAYFDVGNVVLYGYPQDWITTLGSRIAKLHLKDFRFPKRATAEWVDLREGEIDWKAIHRALIEIGYKGYATVELGVKGRGRPYLEETSKRFDLILQGA
ncbi:MAG: sugar phosphate isomerase/epimerase [Bryobacteraceae bacterium]|nr:sugar phosphate isomerase/epimerase [Bryobacteraceae bacterium]